MTTAPTGIVCPSCGSSAVTVTPFRKGDHRLDCSRCDKTFTGLLESWWRKPTSEARSGERPNTSAQRSTEAR